MGVKTRSSLALLVSVALGAALCSFALSVAFADDGYVADEDDSPGPFDIERFGFFQEASGGHLTIDLYEPLDPSLLDEPLNWIGFILEDDIVSNGYVNAVFVTADASGLRGALYGPGYGGPDESRYIEDVDVQMTDADTLDVYLEARRYAGFHHWFAQTGFETIGEDDRGFPECNWPMPPPRPSPPVPKCIDESTGISPTVDESPGPTVTSTPSDPPCAFRQSQCQKNHVTIHRGTKYFYGVVRHRVDACESGRRVVLRTSDGDTVGRDLSDGDGKWRVRLVDAEGSFFAVAKSKVVDGGYGDLSCRRERSITIEG